MRNDRPLTLTGHLLELRSRLLKCVVAIIITTSLSFIFADKIFEILVKPAGQVNFIYIEVTEMIGIYMKVCLAAGIILAVPYLTYQAVMFMAPALNSKEKKYVGFILPWVGLMFIGGVIFGYFVLLPPAMKFLLTFGSNIATPQIKIANYVEVIVRLLLAIGLVFELPVLTTFLARIGIISSKWMAGKRKIAFVLAFVLAAIITPTVDPINMSLVAIPLVVLYELSIWLAKLVEVRKRRAVQYQKNPAAAV